MAYLGFRPGTMEIVGLRDFLKTLDRMNLNVKEAGTEALLKVGVHLETKLKKKLSKPATGKIYSTGRKGKKYKYYKASAPGLPPAVATGRLRASITHNVTGRPGNQLPNPGGGFHDVRALVGTNVYYGYYLERGTPTMLPRPWFYITVQQQANNTRNIIVNGLRQYIRRMRLK